MFIAAKRYLADKAAERMKAGGEAQGARGKEGGRGKKKPSTANSTQRVSGFTSLLTPEATTTQKPLVPNSGQAVSLAPAGFRLRL
jgi:hypothetical protein